MPIPRSPPVPAWPKDPAFESFLQAASLGQPLQVELYPASKIRRSVRAYYAILTGRGTVRVGVLVRPSKGDTREALHSEGQREACSAWLRYMGVPCLRIGFRLDVKFYVYVSNPKPIEATHV